MTKATEMKLTFHGVPEKEKSRLFNMLSVTVDISDDSEYEIYSDYERQKTFKAYVLDSLWNFNPSFLRGHFKVDLDEETIKEISKKLYKKATPLFRALIKNLTKFLNAVRIADGYGYFLSPYNGKEIELKTPAGTYYAYRTN